MSAITKVFVILHVVMSMLLTAGLIVFVNRVENFKELADRQKTELAAVRTQADRAADEAQVAKSDAALARSQAQDEVEAVQSKLDEANTTITGQKAQLADAASRQATDAASIKSTTDALNVAQETVKVLQGQLTELRGGNDKLVKQNTEQNLTISDLNNRLDVALRRFRDGQEQITALQEQIADMRAGGPRKPGDEIGDIRETREVPINGVVRDKRNIDGIWYATISVGSSDAVTRGTQFRVIDRDSGEFLGYLTVQSVEPNESTGRLEGPQVDAIKPGSEVRTQL